MSRSVVGWRRGVKEGYHRCMGTYMGRLSSGIIDKWRRTWVDYVAVSYVTG